MPDFGNAALIAGYMMDLHFFQKNCKHTMNILTYHIYLNVELAMLHNEKSYQV